MLGNVAFTMFAAAMLIWTVKGRLPWLLVLVSIVLLSSLNTTKHVYRAMTWRDGDYVGVAERANNWMLAIEQTYSGRAEEALVEGADSTASRLRTFAQVAQMFDWVPEHIPYAGPDQWLAIPLDFVPRLFWPQKEAHVMTFNVRYTMTFGLQNKRTTGTAITLPVVGDGYWRLGWLGVCIEAILFGTMIGILEGLAHSSSRALVIICLSFTIGYYFDQHIFAAISGLPQQLLLLATVLFGVRALTAVINKSRMAVKPLAPPTIQHTS
jgi:hypothetical protein